MEGRGLLIGLLIFIWIAYMVGWLVRLPGRSIRHRKAIAQENRDLKAAIVDTEKASNGWDEATGWDGNNRVSRATGSPWEHETLYCSSTGRYYLVHTSQYQGTPATARWVSTLEAAAWLLLMAFDLPEDLEPYRDQISE